MVINPDKTVDIKDGKANKDSVTINVGKVVELHNTDTVDYNIALSYKKNNSNDNYPLWVYLPQGGKLYFTGDSASTCEYNIYSVTASPAQVKPPLTGPYTITVSS